MDTILANSGGPPDKEAAAAAAVVDPDPDPDLEPAAGDELSTEQIGVETEGEAGAEVAAGVYHCANCLDPITQGMAKCPTCEVTLKW